MKGVFTWFRIYQNPVSLSNCYTPQYNVLKNLTFNKSETAIVFIKRFNNKTPQ